MFKNIKEFVKVFEDAYFAINIKKFNAKNDIEYYRKEVEQLSKATKTMNNLYDNLIDAYKYFPIKERQDFITKTLDLIIYGRKDSNGSFMDICGLRALYYAEADSGKNNLAHLKDLYNEGKYDEVVAKTEEYSNRLEEFYVLYGIEENTTEENE